MSEDAPTSAGHCLRRTRCGHVLLLTLSVLSSPGCSLIFTQAPRTEVQPTPPCNASVAAPVADTVLAAASVGLIIAGVVVATSCKSGGIDNLCFAPLYGLGAVLAGTLTGALFTTSAVVGYERTSGCRALKASEVPPGPVTASSRLLLPAPSSAACPVSGDAPRMCPARAE
jgi:hypothetical protein